MRIVRIAALAALVPLTGALLRAPRLSAQQAPGITWDFETGNLSGWTATGNAFRFQPIRGDNVQARGRGQPSNHAGAYWVGTFEDNRAPGAVQGDEPTGTLTSGEFVVPDRISFLVGGGGSRATRVELIVQYRDAIEGSRVVLTATGADEETMRRQVWDVRQWAGQVGWIRIVDEASGPWGHINVDDFRFGAPQLQVPQFEAARFEAVQQERAVPVPPLSDRTVEEAREILAESRLSLGQVSGRVAEQEPGRIVDQSPPPQSVVPVGSAVDVTVSQWVTVPPLGRRDVNEARAILARLQLGLGEVAEREADETPGTVLDQVPQAGSSVPPGTRVDLVVAIPRTVVVPSVLGRDLAGARGVLRQAELNVGTVDRQLAARPIGTVIGQSPLPDSRVPPGDRVDLVLARGEQVPDLQGMDGRAAAATLARLGLQPGRETRRGSPRPVGTVIEQSIPAGREVPMETRVDLVLAQGAAVPNLNGADEGAAAEALAVMGLRSGRVTRRPSARPMGTVVEQSIPAGREVPLETPVDIVLAQGVRVPDLTGMDAGPAADTLTRLGLRPGTVTPQRSAARIGTVVRSVPADREVPLETPVDLIVAEGVPVPDLVGMDFTTARDALIGLELGASPPAQEPSTRPPGTVLRQAPLAGVDVPLLTTVELVVAQGVEVPDLTALDSAAARGALEQEGLALGPVVRSRSAETPGTVIGHRPPAGDVVALATVVTVELAAPAPIPSLVGLDSAVAHAVVVDSGFVFQTEVRRRWSLEPTGRVLSQTPAAGDPQPLETPVEVVVARHIPVVPLTGGFLLAAAGIVGYVARRPPKEHGKKDAGAKASTRDESGRSDASPRLPEPFRAEPRVGDRDVTFTSPPPTTALEVHWRIVVDGGRQSREGPGPGIESEKILPAPPGPPRPDPDARTPSPSPKEGGSDR